ncbi:hypothetical protein B0H13DRAFT_2394342 [Mycena leptocephala]|nr:hypothetical protein B0H13DRAFT_2394342 [Mycena leptocephala]
MNIAANSNSQRDADAPAAFTPDVNVPNIPAQPAAARSQYAASVRCALPAPARLRRPLSNVLACPCPVSARRPNASLCERARTVQTNANPPPRRWFRTYPLRWFTPVPRDLRGRPCAMQTPPHPPLRERPPPERCKTNERAAPLVSHLPPALVHPCTAATTFVAAARDVKASAPTLNTCHANARPPNEYAPPGR